jgi:hypothetical protein
LTVNGSAIRYPAPAHDTKTARTIAPECLFEAVDQAQVPIVLLQAMNDYDMTPSLVLSAEMAKLGKPDQVKVHPAYGSTPQDGRGGSCTNAPNV